MTLIMFWVGYAFFGILAASLVFVWAVRNRQFSDQDRARFLALWSGDPVDPGDCNETAVGRVDRYTGIILILLTLALLGVSAWLGYRLG